MYPKIRIDLDNDKLKALNIVWELFTPGLKTQTQKEGKVTLEILNEVKEILIKKELLRQFKDGDFFVKIKFYQAVKFNQYLSTWISVFNPEHYPYEWNVIHSICNKMNQDLA